MLPDAQGLHASQLAKCAHLSLSPGAGVGSSGLCPGQRPCLRAWVQLCQAQTGRACWLAQTREAGSTPVPQTGCSQCS